MKKIIPLLLFLISSGVYAQFERQIDSLQKAVKTEKDPYYKANALLELALIYLDSDPEKAQPLLDELKALGIARKTHKELAFAYLYEGHLKTRLGKMDEAVVSYQKSIEEAALLKDPYTYLIGKSNLAQTYMDTGKEDQAETLLLAVEAQYKRAPKTFGLEGIYFLLGVIYKEKGHLNTALKYLHKTDAMIKKSDLDGVFMRIGVFTEIATIYKDLGNQTKALESINKALELQQQDTSQMGPLMEILVVKGEILLAFDEHEKARPLFEQVFNHAQTSKQKQLLDRAAIGLGDVWQRKGDYKKSEHYLDIAKVISLENNTDYFLTHIYTLSARNHIRTKNPKRYHEFVTLAEQMLANEKESQAYLELIKTKIEFAKANNQLDQALKLTQQRDELQQKLDQKADAMHFEDFETKYQSEKKAQQIKLLSVQKQLAEKQKNTQLVVFSTLLLLLVLGGYLIYASYKNRLRTAEKLREINDMKSRFFANISHEFRTPLTLIKSPLQTLRASKMDDTQNRQLSLIDKNADRMLELVNQLLELSKIDGGHFKLILKEGQLDEFLSAMIEPFAFQASETGTPLITNIEKTTTTYYFDKDIIEKIASNLLSNAFKYAPPQQPIYFSATVTQNQLELRVANAGTDLKKEDLPKLFERFYQKNESANSSGIGLALVKELVDLYKGSIEAGIDGQMLRFLVRLPLDASHPNALPQPQTEAPIEVPVADVTQDLPILLLVDDNAEIRQVLRALFEPDYQIVEAANGQEALKVAQKEIPDCIVSDIMMPKMDGLAFTHALKTNELTSFIPLVLLTAKTSDETHLQALQNTADAFLTKPFNHDILKATVAQLIAERRKLQQRYSQELVLKPMDVVINTVDERFLDKLQQVIATELANADFSTDDFAKSVGMSRMQLHRKLKTLLGVSATEFLRNERLKVAAGLLRSKNANVSEIAYAVGFNDLSYFSKCFKEHFKTTPTDYANNG
ncbi:response regulator [Flavobacterium caeni]|uniref:histidine kinase n=1 Tax=Flavobacterium caeni TaxID=490189 RepID=A0A1G5K8R5_9FLAO|nr:response regulator [Flavobacterium caeni]SCY97043.1 Signal transduction histidine kinase [Flavobacterium caeni]